MHIDGEMVGLDILESDLRVAAKALRTFCTAPLVHLPHTPRAPAITCRL